MILLLILLLRLDLVIAVDLWIDWNKSSNTCW